MAVSRIHFALNDLISEIKRLVPEVEAPHVDIHMDAKTHAKVVGELEYLHGAPLQREKGYRLGVAVKYQGARLISILPGNRVS